MNFVKLADRGKSVLPIALSCIIVVFGIYGDTAIIPHFVNADSLQPPHMAWDMTRHAYAVTNFQWSRVPSFPDLAFFFAMDWMSIGWRTAYLAYTCAVAATAILALGWVVAHMRGRPYGEGVFWAGIAVTIALAILSGAAALGPDHTVSWRPQSYLFIANFHGDAFLLSVLASCTALGALHGRRGQAWITWALCVVGTASDTIFLGYFLMPFALAALLAAVRHRGRAGVPSIRTTLLFLLSAGAACLVGWIAKYPLPMQAMQLNFPGIPTALANILRDLPRQPWVVTLLLLTLALAVRAGLTLWKRPGHSDEPAVEFDRELLLLTGLAASGMSLGLATLLFVDIDIYRYAMPFFWWPLAIGLGLVRTRWETLSRAVAAVVAVMATALLPLSASALPHWRTPLERCLSDHRAEWGLKAGLATYWNSRITMASSGWALQVDQMNDVGQAYMWGNNMAAYKHDMHAPQRAPEYNFIVVDEATSTFDLETEVGSPARTETCGTFGIWIFDQPFVPAGADARPSGKLGVTFIPK